MFTGIITTTGKVEQIKKNKSFILTVEANKIFVKKAKLGTSIAVDGVCLTVAKKTVNTLTFELMPETVQLTIADSYKTGTVVNLEHSMRVCDEIGGHFVAGHVDGIGKVVKIKKQKNAMIFSIKPPRKLMKYLAHKGSVAINGVSLTVIGAVDKFDVSLVSYTLKHTNLSKLRVNDKVNVEVDLLARYIHQVHKVKSL